jgi:hypothetical protein
MKLDENFYTVCYRDCQKNVPIEDRFSATTPYAAILFSERYYDNSYRPEIKKVADKATFFIKKRQRRVS